MVTSNDHLTSTVEREYLFDPFRFLPGQQLLLHGEAPVRLGSRALDILAELVERPGELVSKRELIARAWPSTVVEEGNLKVHVAALRRALCEGGKENRYIATVTGRGYRFVAPVTCKTAQMAAAPVSAAWEQMNRLPAPLTRMTGRAETVAALLGSMEQRRLVSIVGPGGIGKSTVALALAEAFIATTGMEICFVDLGPLADAQFVAGSVASALGLSIHSGDAVPSLVASLQERRLLLVLDSCDHVIDTVALLAGRILGGAPGVQVLATSREPLRAAGEHVYRLGPLAYPPADAALTALQALEFPAVHLFVLRASECLDGYRLSDADAPAVAEICRRLEGMPLAIELAAMRMDALGAHALAARLDDRFQLLKRGSRRSVARHRTLEAALDWSYEVLPESERALLRGLSVFAGAFTLDAATGLWTDAAADASTVVDGVANLVDKSLLLADVSRPCVHYRLLDTTRAYAREKLDRCGETEAMRRRHAAFHRDLLERASGEWGRTPPMDWLAGHGRCLYDVRSALAWAFSPRGDPALGISLSVAAIPLWMELLLLDECRQCVERALSVPHPSAGDEMRLRAALGAATLYASGPVPAADAAWTRALELADEQGNDEYRRMALWGMAVCRSYAGEFQAVLALAGRFRALAGDEGDRSAAAVMDRLAGSALHHAGEQAAARRYLERMLDQYVAPVRGSRLLRVQPDQRSAALGTLANVLWLQGYPDQAVQTARAALEEARRSGHAPSLMNAITHAAFPVMVQVGDYPAAEGLLAELSACLASHALALWEYLRDCLDASLQALRGDASGLPRLHRAVDRLQEAGYRLHLGSHLGTLAAAFGAEGRRDAGLALVRQALSLCEAGEERWCHAELLRIEGELLEPGDGAAAEQLYRQALAVARQQGALSWELRAATSLAQLKMRQGAAGEGRRLLADVYASFTEGFASADLRKARRLLDQAF
ncbi:ATP-binding protein [Massilia niastensis]|uniref:ATP-binding protein n=1 Tax=Massilia niastensis TaxID=544911 RepID=UPI000361919C|nr:winged helix-turn-helix domain-containing protein [Massilia niastensis]